VVDRPDEDMADLLRPQVRPLEAIHYRHKGQDMFCLRDPSRLSDRELHVSADVFLIASLFDGERGLTDVQSEVACRVGSPVASADIQKVVDALDNAHFLEGAAFERWRAEVEDEFRAAPVRASVLAGNCYPEDHRDIPKFLDKYFLGSEGPGEPGEVREGATPLRGLVVPHIDLKRGGVSFAHAYKELREAMRPETVVILGVAHAGRGELFTLTRKDYDTPFGNMKTDVEIVDRLAAAAGDGAFADEYSHKGEHSIEIASATGPRRASSRASRRSRRSSGRSSGSAREGSSSWRRPTSRTSARSSATTSRSRRGSSARTRSATAGCSPSSRRATPTASSSSCGRRRTAGRSAA
jgi:hypothetical protein